MNAVQLSITNNDARQALAALDTLAKQRGFSTTDAALAVGRTIRKLREVVAQLEEARQALINAHCKRDADGQPILTALGEGSGVQLATPAAFLAEAKQLANRVVEIEVFPIALKALGAGRGLTCEKCGLLKGMPEAEQFATLLDVGILFDETSA